MEWISVKDGLPEKSGITRVKINNYDSNTCERFFSGFCGFWTYNMRKVEGVTHWMSLPTPPKEDVS